MNNVSEVTLEVGFEDGQRAVFGVSNDGQLQPSTAPGDRLPANLWVRAVEYVEHRVLRKPEHDYAVTSPDGPVMWPWSLDASLDGIAEMAARYVLLDNRSRRGRTDEERHELQGIVASVSTLKPMQMAYFCQQAATHCENAAKICLMLTVLNNRIGEV